MIASRRRRDNIAAEIAAIEDMLSEIPEDEVANRAGLESQLTELRERAAQESIPDVKRWARASLIFGGEPVVGGIGIEAEFAVDAVGCFQNIVSVTAASRRHEEIKDSGPVPGKKDTKLHIVGTIRGSFGFELEEVEPQSTFAEPEFGVTQLATDVEFASMVIAAAGETDAAFADAVSDLDERAVLAVRNFFEVLHRRKATFRLATEAVDKSFDHQAIAAAEERTKAEFKSEDDVPIVGTFLGAMPARKAFEMTDDAGEVVRGSIGAGIREDDIISMNRRWSGENCVVHARRVRLSRAGSPEQVRYTLLRILPR